MNVTDVLYSPWAIVPDRLLQIQAIYAAHTRGEKADLAALEAQAGKPLQNDPQGYVVRNGAALIPLRGVIAKRMNMFSAISGGASSELMVRDVRQALDDPAVKSIVLLVDSPGGTVDGTQAAAAAIRSARARKPIAAFSDGMMASASYWFGSAAGSIYIDSGTAQVGSIGVVATHVDVSRREEMLGVKTTEIVAGKYKRIASQYGPLTEDGRVAVQEQVDYLYSLFVADVAEHRGVSVDQVLSGMADGRIFTGAQAIDAGLVDGMTTLDDLIARLNTSTPARTTVPLKGITMSPPNTVTQSRRAPQAARSTLPPDLQGIPLTGNGAPRTASEMAFLLRPSEWCPTVEQRVKVLASLHASGRQSAEYPVDETEAKAWEAFTAAARAEPALVRQGDGGGEPQRVDPGISALLGSDSHKTHAAAVAFRQRHPGVSYIDAVKAVLGAEGIVLSPAARGSTLTSSTDFYALDDAAKAYQAAHPGTDYITAVKAIQKGA